MIRNFLRETSLRIEAREINMETGEVKLYSIDNQSDIPFPYGEFETTVSYMGYDTPKAYIKEMKRRGILGEEVEHNRQRANEISGILQLARFRHDNNWSLMDIPVRLTTYYNLTEEYAKKIVRYITENNIERHTVSVYDEGNNLLVSTEINGSPEEIENFYKGLVIDDVEAVRVEFAA